MTTPAPDEDDLEAYFLAHYMPVLPTVLAETGSLHPHARHHEATKLWRLLDEASRTRVLTTAAAVEHRRNLELLVAEAEIRRIREEQRSRLAEVLAFVLQVQWLWLAASIILIVMLASGLVPVVTRTLAVAGGVQTAFALLLMTDPGKTGKDRIQTLLATWPALPMLAAACLALLI
jgi:hypothetical protein